MNNYEKYFGTKKRAKKTLDRMRWNYGVCVGFITESFPQEPRGDCDGCRWRDRIAGVCEAPSFESWLNLETNE